MHLQSLLVFQKDNQTVVFVLFELYEGIGWHHHWGCETRLAVITPDSM
jgi:hypothetical protein